MSKYQVGDEIDLRMRVVAVDEDGDVQCVVVGAVENVANFMTLDELDAGKLVERPLRVGDETHLGVILAIDGDEAWVKRRDCRGNLTYYLRNLERVPR